MGNGYVVAGGQKLLPTPYIPVCLICDWPHIYNELFYIIILMLLFLLKTINNKLRILILSFFIV